jgi:hypothetical protein
MLTSVEEYRKYHHQVLRFKERERGNPAIFFLRLLMEGKDIKPHLPIHSHNRNHLAKQITKILFEGLNIAGTNKYIKIYLPSDIVLELVGIFWNPIKFASAERRCSVHTTFLWYLRNNGPI